MATADSTTWLKTVLPVIAVLFGAGGAGTAAVQYWTRSACQEKNEHLQARTEALEKGLKEVQTLLSKGESPGGSFEVGDVSGTGNAVGHGASASVHTELASAGGGAGDGSRDQQQPVPQAQALIDALLAPQATP